MVDSTAAASSGRVRVACIQAPSVLGDTAGNCATFDRLTREAAAKGAKFIVLPEAALTGYLSQDLRQSWHVPGRPLKGAEVLRKLGADVGGFEGVDPESCAESVPGPVTARFCGLARELGVYITVPLVEKVERTEAPAAAGFFPSHPFLYYNTIALAAPDGSLAGHYRKNNHWGYVDNAWMTAGTDAVTVETEFGRVGLAVCFDVHIMLKRYGELRERRPWLLLYCIAWVDNEAESWFDYDLPERISAQHFHVAGANWSVSSPELGSHWSGYGHSGIYAPDGARLACATTRVGEEVVYADVPTEAAMQEGLQEGISSDLVDPVADPPWSRRTKSFPARYAQPYHFHVGRCRLRIDQAQPLGGTSGFQSGMTVWDSALVLAKFLEMQQERGTVRLQGQSVVELGSGTGICGLACACLGAAVTLTDLDEPAILEALLRRVESNLPSVSLGSARVVAHNWGDDVTPLGSPHLVVAADVLYDDCIVAPLLTSLVALRPQRAFIAFEQHKHGPLRLFREKAADTFLVSALPAEQLHPIWRLGGVGIFQLDLRS